ncbi:outer membrane beta-barrel protein [Gluconacetobacter tumulisoli]|uniref:outer membrane beta-barrel protein n=1 Tax=Gluconacetobacter tumulisoli TaxID=1286189 RepID=UPI0030844233
MIDAYFPPLGTGFGDLTTEPEQVRTLEHYAPQGLRYGPVQLDASGTESVGYDNNADRLANGRGSAVVTSSGRASAVARWQRDQVHADMSVDDFRFISQPIQNRTNWTVAAGGTHDFGHDQLGVAYTHLSLVQTPVDLGALGLSQPVPYQYDTARISYTATTHGRFSFIPEAQLSRFHFGRIDPSPMQIDQSYRNRAVITEGITGRYELAQGRQILVMLQGTEIRYMSGNMGLPTRDSNGASGMVGMDFGLSGPLRFRALVGYQTRQYRSSVFGHISSPMAEAELGWSPTRLTMATLTVRHGIEDSAFENVVGFSYTSADIGVRHAYSRNIVLMAHAALQKADYPRTPEALNNTVLTQVGANQALYSVGVGANWLMNRHISWTFNYNFSSQHTVGAGSFPDHTVMLGLRFSL